MAKRVSKATINRRVNLYEKMIKSGKSIRQVKLMNMEQYNNTFGTNITLESSLNAQRKNLMNQIRDNIDVIVAKYIEKEQLQNPAYKKFLYAESYKLFRVKEHEKKKPEFINNIDNAKEITKEGQYGLIEIVNMADDKSYYIKYNSQKQLENRLDDLKTQYKIKHYYSIFHGAYMYKTEITKEFKKSLAKIK